MKTDIYHFVRTDFSIPVDIYYDFQPGGENLIETRIVLDSPPCSEMIFGINSKGHHSGTNRQDLGGGISPQSRQREALNQEIISQIYQEEAGFQRRCFFSPLSVSLDVTLEARGVSEADVSFIEQIPNSRNEFMSKMEKNALRSIVLYRILCNKKINSNSNQYNTIEKSLVYARRSFILSVLYHDKCKSDKSIRKELLPLLIK